MTPPGEHFITASSQPTKTGAFSHLANGVTTRKTNMSSENQWLEDVFPIEIAAF